MNGFAAAVERHQRKVYTFARYYLGNAEEAKDITQDVLLKLWQSPLEIDEEGQRAWLLKVTRNACFDRLRRRTSTAKIFTEDPEQQTAMTMPDNEPSPEIQATAKDFRQHLQQALEELKDPMKSIVILREIEGLAYQEISEVLDVPLNTVRVYLHRGRRLIRRQLSEVYGNVGSF